MRRRVKKHYSGNEVKRYLGSLKEYFTDGVKAIGEKVDFLEGKMERRFGDLDKTLKVHTDMIGNIMIQLEEIKGELKQKVDYQDFIRLERRVVRLEARGGRRRPALG